MGAEDEKTFGVFNDHDAFAASKVPLRNLRSGRREGKPKGKRSSRRQTSKEQCRRQGPPRQRKHKIPRTRQRRPRKEGKKSIRTPSMEPKVIHHIKTAKQKRKAQRVRKVQDTLAGTTGEQPANQPAAARPPSYASWNEKDWDQA